ncbi:glycerol dehydratase reactivase beta/small subunit family protein [Enterococcus sp. CSURQ0835]|uniref:glycerol dehydratase reactivase beta/small subunit family protein n=1 Tax=Enterococcus sp. CSURQ0835 TaxID=2681394 RepID=UPI00135A84DA|nr:glycerol dehydratase reactivase beta/small subunit family protein [Enterococcus sp. CSURQ0835]
MVKRPTIYVATLAEKAPLALILAGIEEEEVPYELVTTEKKDRIAAAFELATRSPLAVGVVIDQTRAVLHYKNLPAEKPLFEIPNETTELMKLGANAARLVKGIPFKPLKEV